MARLPKSFRNSNRTTESFRRQFASLPVHIQALTKSACRLFDRDRAHPSLRHHRLEVRRGSQLAAQSWSVSVTMQYRAIYVTDPHDTNIGYWIGTHAEYDSFTGG